MDQRGMESVNRTLVVSDFSPLDGVADEMDT